MRISSKIFLGFGIIIILMLGNISFSVFNNTKTQKEIDEVKETSFLLESTYSLEREVTEIQLSVIIFSKTGNSSAIRQVIKIDKRLEALIKSISENIEGRGSVEFTKKVNSFRSNYLEGFKRFVDDRRKKDDLYELCRKLVKDIKVELNLLIKEDVNLILASNTFSNTENLMVNFIEEPDSSIIRLFNKELSEVKASVLALNATKLKGNLDLYEQRFSDLVQSIRGYLFLSNVVLAGQVAEFKYTAKSFRENLEIRENELLTRLSNESQLSSDIEIALAFLLVGIGLFSSWRIGHSISDPITKMKETFSDLSLGATIHEIPGLDYKDEIGEMAKAAQVFKEKNQETEILLKKSQEAEYIMKTQTEELGNVNSELEQFAYVASHDLQEPLRMVASYVQLLGQEYKDQLDEDAQEYIDFASEGAKRMQLLISDLLNLSRVGRIDSEVEKVNTAEVFNAVCKDLDEIIQEKGVELTIGTLPIVDANPRQIHQIMQNFLGNAIKYKQKDVVLNFKVECEERDDEWVFSFKDNGIGIDSKHFDRIFKIFQRLHSRSDYEGSGMGLAIVKKISEQHQGKVWVESKVGLGSTFFFSIRK